MRNIFTSLLFIVSSFAYSQNYTLFNSSSKKLFTDSSNTFSMAFDSVKANGSDSVYYNFCRLNDTLVPSDSCSWWGPTACYQQDKPVWTGGKIIYDNVGIYQFRTLAGDTLTFDFTKIIGDTSLIYKNGAQKLQFIFKKSDTLTTLNYFDSARFYKILHTDLAGNPINSKLNGKEIVIAKNLGLVQFFQVDSFPQVLRPLYLAGNESPSCGLTQLTDEIVYDYQPGDEIQSYDYYNQNPWAFVNRYIKYTFLNRTTTVDSLIYNVIVTIYDTQTWKTTIDTTIIKYYRQHIIAQIPFERYDGYVRRLHLSDYCGIKLWAYDLSPQPYLGYCSMDNCWGWVDTGGPQPQSNTTYVTGLGLYHWSQHLVQPPPQGYGKGTYVVYFKKNGIPCDTEIVMGVNSIHYLDNTIVVKPNPAIESITITSTISLKMATIFDIQGREILSENISGNERMINVKQLDPGIYFLRIETSNGVAVRKIIKE